MRIKLNLQLFASIVDYLNSKGQDSSFNARKQLATQHGITNYTGTVQQNTQLLKILQGNSSTSTASQSSNTSNNTTSNQTNTTTAQKSNVKLNGVDQSVLDRMNSQFQTSTAYQEAMTQVQSLLDKINTGKTSYSDQIKDLMSKIQNREDFSYDVDSDQMFQQYLSSMMSMGQTAMQDTMGQASALTGGYGSSYSQAVGNQAYNDLIQGAYDNLPEFYNMAMQTYQMEGEEMYNQLAMLNDADATEYGRLVDMYNANKSNADTMYDREYQTWSDDVSQATQIAGMQNSDWWNNKNYEESVRQFNENLALQREQFNWQKSQAGKSSGGGTSKKTSTSGDGSPKLKKPDPKMYDEAIKRYATGGMSGLNAYLNSLPDSYNKTLLAEHVGAYGKELPKNWNALGFNLNLK